MQYKCVPIIFILPITILIFLFIIFKLGNIIIPICIYVLECVCVSIQFCRVRWLGVVTGRRIHYNMRDQRSFLDFTALRTVLVILSRVGWFQHLVAYYDIPIYIFVCVCLSTLLPDDKVAVKLSSDIYDKWWWWWWCWRYGSGSGGGFYIFFRSK